MDLPAIGDHILGYRVSDVIAIAGQAVVLQCASPRTRDVVVIKVLSCEPASPNYAQELARAKRCAALRINHRCVLDPIDSGMEGGRFCTVFPFVPGDDLTHRIMRSGAGLPHKEVAGVILDLADGLGAIHAKGIVHRDIKTDNVIIHPSGAAVIIDLGICRRIGEPTLTTGPGLLGTPGTMAPEQFRDPKTVDHRADIYSAGVVAVECLTGRRPFPTDSNHAANGRRPIPPSRLNPLVMAEFDQLCMKMLEPDPEDRFQSAREVRAACEPIARRLGCVRPGLPPAPPATGPRCLACGAHTGSSDVCPGCKRPFLGACHRLLLQSGPGAGEVFDAPQGTYIVGRLQLCAHDHHMSRQQMRVNCINGTLLIADGGGLNPTMHEDHPIKAPITLRSGAKVRLGVSWATYLHL